MSAPTFPAAWERYYHHLRVEAERRPRTIAAYRFILWNWHGWLQAKGKTWNRATDKDVGRWLDRPTHSGRARGERIGANTRQQYLHCLRGFYAWAERERLIGRGRNPAALLRASGAVPVPRALPLADLRTVLVGAEHDTRLETMVALAYFGALRCAEIAAVAIEDVHLDDQPRLLVHGKGGRDRVVPLHPEAVRVIRRHLAHLGQRVGPLVAGRGQSWGKPMTPQSVSRALSDHLRGLGLDATAHSLRHSAATEALRAGQGKNLENVRELLGHRDARTTRRYTMAYDYDVAGTVELLPDPRGNGKPVADLPQAMTGLAALVPVDVRDQLAAAVAVLDERGLEVVQAVTTLARCTHQAWLATLGVRTDAEFLSLHPGDPRLDHTDEEWEACEKALGIDRGWAIAYAVRDAVDDQ